MPGVETPLSQKMRALHKQRDDLPENWLELADKFDAAAEGFYAAEPTCDVRQFLGHYARAKRAWCDATGEPLINEGLRT